MIESNDRIDAVIEAFLRHLDGDGDEPSLDHLSEDERTRAEQLIESVKAGRGIDPYASKPSLEQLLAGTEFEAALELTTATRAVARDLADEIRRQVEIYTAYPVEVWPDAAAEAIGVKSDMVALVASQRLRIQVRSELTTSAELVHVDPGRAAGPIYGAFPDTAGVILVVPDDELSSLVIDPFETEFCIQTPSGSLEAPATHRAVLPFADAVRSYVDELAPSLEPALSVELMAADEVDVLAVARGAATSAVDAVVVDGNRAKIDAKRRTWSSLGDLEIAAVTDAIAAAMQGADPESVARRIEELTEAA